MTGPIRLILARLRHRRRDVMASGSRAAGGYVAACSCGWRAEHPHWYGSLSIEDDWQEHLNSIKPNPPTRRDAP